MHRAAGGDELCQLCRVPQLARRLARVPLDGFGQLHHVEEARRAAAALD
jgi:hypothetical protein